MAIDIGDKAIEEFSAIIKDAKTVLWNGPMGVFEMDCFAKGTKEVAEALADSSAISIVGGGDSVTAAKKFKVQDKLSFCSTGGGASLELLEGKVLPGVGASDRQALLRQVTVHGRADCFRLAFRMGFFISRIRFRVRDF